MNPNNLGRAIQGGNAETKQAQRQRRDREAMPLYRGRFAAEKVREMRELQREIGDGYE